MTREVLIQLVKAAIAAIPDVEIEEHVYGIVLKSTDEDGNAVELGLEYL